MEQTKYTVLLDDGHKHLEVDQPVIRYRFVARNEEHPIIIDDVWRQVLVLN